MSEALKQRLEDFLSLPEEQRQHWEMKAHPNTHPLIPRGNAPPLPDPFVEEYARCLPYCAYAVWSKRTHGYKEPFLSEADFAKQAPRVAERLRKRRARKTA